MENIFEVLIISIVQGITEFLPVSSSAHLNLLSNLFGFREEELLINISAHVGSLFAVIFFFKKEIISFGKNQKLFLRIILASLPLFLFGYLIINYNLVPGLRTYKIIGWTTLIFGIILYISDKQKITRKIEKNFQNKPAIIIGIFQILSLIPGVSRSGITITAGRFLGFSRTDASKISFFLAIPTLVASSILGIYDLSQEGNHELNAMALISVVFSFIFAYLTIKFFLNYIKKFSLTIFVVYRLLISLILIYLIYL